MTQVDTFEWDERTQSFGPHRALQVDTASGAKWLLTRHCEAFGVHASLGSAISAARADHYAEAKAQVRAIVAGQP